MNINKLVIDTAIRRGYIKTFGMSMLPLLADGDIVYFRHVSFQDIKTDDIVIARFNSKLVTHRVVHKKIHSVHLKGDNNYKAELSVSEKSIEGLVYKIKRGNQIITIDSLYLYQSLLYRKCLGQIARAFARNSITWVVLKGLPLHEYYGAYIPRRLFADVDILVDALHWDNATNILNSLGFVSNNAKKLVDMYAAGDVEAVFRRQEDGFIVEVDMHLEPVSFIAKKSIAGHGMDKVAYDLWIQSIFTTAKKVKSGSVYYRILSPVSLTVYLLIHVYCHNFTGYFRYRLLDTIIRKHSSVKYWNEVIPELKKWNITPALYAGLLNLRRYYDTPIPDICFEKLRPNWVQRLYISVVLQEKVLFNDMPRVARGVWKLIHMIFLGNGWGNPFNSLFLLSKRVRLFPKRIEGYVVHNKN